VYRSVSSDNQARRWSDDAERITGDVERHLSTARNRLSATRPTIVPAQATSIGGLLRRGGGRGAVDGAHVALRWLRGLSARSPWVAGCCPPPPQSAPARPQRLAVTAGKLPSPDPSGPVRIPDRRVIAQARVAFEVRLDNARPDGTGVLTGDGVVRRERFSDRPAAAPDRSAHPPRREQPRR
jgi:hypothetical protein